MKTSDLQKLSKHLFWDLNFKTLDAEKNKTIIIERVFNRGDLEDVILVVKIYGLETVKQELLKAGFLDKKTLNWASSFFDIPKTEFRCYKKMQSSHTHWNY